MNLCPTMQFVMMRSYAEAIDIGRRDPTLELMFLGILYLAEMQVEDIMPSARSVGEVAEDLDAVRSELVAHDIDPVWTLERLRNALSAGAPLGELWEIGVCMDFAANSAALRGADRPWAQDVLKAMLDHPPETIRQIVTSGSEAVASDGGKKE